MQRLTKLSSQLASAAVAAAADDASSSPASPEAPATGGWATRDRQQFRSGSAEGGFDFSSVLPELSPYSASPAPPQPLAPEEVQRWVAEGYVMLPPSRLAGLPAAAHRAIYEKLCLALHDEYQVPEKNGADPPPALRAAATSLPDPRWAAAGPQPGNNVLARVPELSHVLAHPAVRGAVEALVGPDPLRYPHKFAHNLEPAGITGPALSPGTALPCACPLKPSRFRGLGRAGSGRVSRSYNLGAQARCHQDAYSPLARPRHHFPRFVYLNYYPQDTPLELGPTHLIPVGRGCSGSPRTARAVVSWAFSCSSP